MHPCVVVHFRFFSVIFLPLFWPAWGSIQACRKNGRKVIERRPKKRLGGTTTQGCIRCRKKYKKVIFFGHFFLNENSSRPKKVILLYFSYNDASLCGRSSESIFRLFFFHFSATFSVTFQPHFRPKCAQKNSLKAIQRNDHAGMHSL